MLGQEILQIISSLKIAYVVKNNDKGKHVYSGFGITFDSAGLWGFDKNDKNVIIFGVDNTSLFYADNLKNNFLVLGEGPLFSISGAFGSAEKKVSIIFS